MLQMRKMTILSIFILILGLGTTVFATQADEPMRAYKKFGKEYSMEATLLREANPELNYEFSKIANHLGIEEPIIYHYHLDEIGTMVRGFTRYYNDNSAAIYLSDANSTERIRQIYWHELVHYMYKNVSPLYRKEYGQYVYPNLMESLTDVIARKNYEAMYNSSYVYTYFVTEALEDSFCERLYVGEYNEVLDDPTIISLMEELELGILLFDEEKITVTLQSLKERVAISMAALSMLYETC